MHVQALVRPMQRGSSQPWLVTASDGGQYVVKFAGGADGTRGLLADLIVNRLARHWRLPVPETTTIEVRADLPRAGTDEFWDVLDRSRGVNLALAWIADGVDVLQPDRTLAPTLLHAIAWIDSLFGNADRTAISSNLLRGADGRVWLIDHGSCLFLRRAAPSFGFVANHFLAPADPRTLMDAALPAPIDDAALAALLADVPTAWLTDAGLDPDALVPRLSNLMRVHRQWAASPA